MSKKPHGTRSATNVWLGGQPLPCMDDLKQLPTIGVVLKRVFYDLKVEKLTLSASCNRVVDEVLWLWHMANIPTTQKQNAVGQIKKLYELRQDQQEQTQVQ